MPFQKPEPAGLCFHHWLRWSRAVPVSERLQGYALPTRDNVSCLRSYSSSSLAGLVAAGKLMQAPAVLCLCLSFLCHCLWQYLQPSLSSPNCIKAWYLSLLSLLLQVKSKHSSDSKEKSQREDKHHPDGRHRRAAR